MGATSLGALVGTRGSPGRGAPGGARGVTVLFRLPLAVSGPMPAWHRRLCLVVTLAVWRPRLADACGWRGRAETAGLVGIGDHNRRWSPAAHPGSAMRHMGAGLAIPDFPLAFGRLVPPLDSSAVVVHLYIVWAPWRLPCVSGGLSPRSQPAPG
jgi:hypothetical protein